MAIWKEHAPAKKDPPLASGDSFARRDDVAVAERLTSVEPTPRAGRETRESIIGAELTIQGKIEGAGDIRIAGRFTGDVEVDGNVVIEPGATVNGGVRAHAVTIGGQVDGNILDAARVELLRTGVLIGDLKAGSLTVAEGARMRGRVEFGWGSEDGVRAYGSSSGINGSSNGGSNGGGNGSGNGSGSGSGSGGRAAGS